jgi:hypothetical protein
VRRLLGATLLLGGLAGLVACASAEPVDPAAPSLPLMSQPMAQGYPDLRSVPQNHIANTDAYHWAEVQNDVLTAVADLRDHPRATYGAPPEDPAIFLEEAREDLTETRDSH